MHSPTANYFSRGSVSRAYRAVDRHARERLGQSLCHKHKQSGRGTSRFPLRYVYDCIFRPAAGLPRGNEPPPNLPESNHLLSPSRRANWTLRSPLFQRNHLEMPSVESNSVSSADTRRINLRDFQELSYWAERFGVSRERIIRAVHTAGPIAHDVEREIGETE
jgi:hypothetical protein